MSQRLRILFVALFLIAALLVFMYKANIFNIKERIVDKGVRVTVTISPLDFRIDSTGHISGLQYELVKELLGDTTITWKPVTSREEAMNAIMDGDADLYVTSFPLTAEAQSDKFIATDELYVSGFALIQRKDSLNTNVWQTKFQGNDKVKVYIPKEAKSAYLMLKHLKDFSCPSIDIVLDDRSEEELCMDVALGHIDYTFCDRNLATQISNKLQGLEVIRDIAFDVYQVWLLNPDKRALCDQLDKNIKQFIKRPEYKAILSRYGL